MSVHRRSKQIQFGDPTEHIAGDREQCECVCVVCLCVCICVWGLCQKSCTYVSHLRGSVSLCASVPYLGMRACVFSSVCASVRLHTSVWKSPSDESGVLAEEESQFLLCSSIRSFCSPGTMDSSGVMVLKLSQELWSSGVDLSWWRRRRTCEGSVRFAAAEHINIKTGLR